MGLRFRRTFSIMPGLKLNIGKKSASVSMGVKDLSFTAGTAGQTISASLPGSGLTLRHKIKSATRAPSAITAPEQTLVAAKQTPFHRRRRRWLFLMVVYAVAGLIWWTILQPN
jgi:hypothetical protein